MTSNSSITVAGRRLETKYVAGDSGAPVLVFLHEGLGSIGLWYDVPGELARLTGCSVLVYSRYGNGFSEPLCEPREVSYMHDEARIALPALLEYFSIAQAILVGHSDGASIALIAAAEDRGRIRGVVAEAPHAFVEDLSVESIAAAKSAYESGDLRKRLARHHQDPDRTFYGWNDVWLKPEFRAWDIRPLLAGIRAPLLIVQGAGDEYGTLAQVSAIRDSASGARVDSLVLDRCGHAPHRDRPDLTLLAIAAFTAGVRSAS